MTRERGWLIGFGSLAVIAVVGAVIVNATGLRPPYWVGCAVGFSCVCAAAVAVCAAYASLAGWRWLAPRAGAVLAVSSAAEIIGVYTGWPFGVYSYTRLWLPLISLPHHQRFPVALPITWLILSGAVVLYLGNRKNAPFWGGVLMALVDFALEPVLTGPVGFWRWAEGDPPLINYFGWFAVGTLACWFLRVPTGIDSPKRMGGTLLFATLVGTLTIGVSHGEMRGLYALVPLGVLGMFMFEKRVPAP